MSNIIFLDIDGVLNSYRENDIRKINELNLKILLETLASIECKIVISSTWRKWGYCEFYEVICENNAQYLIDFLHEDWCTSNSFGKTYRGEEVKIWVDKHIKEDIKFLCIDDDEDFLENQPLLKIDPEFGFSFYDKDIVISFFNNIENSEKAFLDSIEWMKYKIRLYENKVNFCNKILNKII